MWFGPGVQVVAQVPVAGPVKNKKKCLKWKISPTITFQLVNDLSENSCCHQWSLTNLLFRSLLGSVPSILFDDLVVQLLKN